MYKCNLFCGAIVLLLVNFTNGVAIPSLSRNSKLIQDNQYKRLQNLFGRTQPVKRINYGHEQKQLLVVKPDGDVDNGGFLGGLLDSLLGRGGNGGLLGGLLGGGNNGGLLDGVLGGGDNGGVLSGILGGGAGDNGGLLGGVVGGGDNNGGLLGNLLDSLLGTGGNGGALAGLVGGGTNGGLLGGISGGNDNQGLVPRVIELLLGGNNANGLLENLVEGLLGSGNENGLLGGLGGGDNNEGLLGNLLALLLGGGKTTQVVAVTKTRTPQKCHCKHCYPQDYGCKQVHGFTAECSCNKCGCDYKPLPQAVLVMENNKGLLQKLLDALLGSNNNKKVQTVTKTTGGVVPAGHGYH